MTTADPVQLREATQDDIPVLLTILQAAFDEYRGRLDPPSGVHAETEETLRRKLSGGAAILGCVGDEPAGCVFYRREPDHIYLGRLSVLPKHRRSGVGRSLVTYAEQNARALGLPVQIGVRLPLSDVRAFWERLGYRTLRYEAHEGYAAPTSVVMQRDRV